MVFGGSAKCSTTLLVNPSTRNSGWSTESTPAKCGTAGSKCFMSNKSINKKMDKYKQYLLRY